MPVQCKLANLFALGPITQILFSYLTIADIYALHGVCRSLHGVVDSLLETRLNINSHLKSFVDDCELFRRRLCQSEAIITGQFVLNFLGLGQRHSTCLDVIAEDGLLESSFEEYLVKKEGYRVISDDQKSVSFLSLRKLNTIPIHPTGRNAASCATALSSHRRNNLYHKGYEPRDT